jgi:hypothetical protein
MENTVTLPYEATALTPGQQEIATLSLETKCLVSGGAGTGKTLVLVHRIAKLVNADHLGPGSEVLVLSFSRNSVREIKNRLGLFGGSVAYVRARTFDSFATRLLNLFLPTEQWIALDYDGRIRLAAGLIRKPEVKSEMANYQHVVVDELQDLVGERSDFVKSILESTTSGFTMLGDPAQGIYNFQVEGVERRVGSAAFYCWLRKNFGKQLLEFSLPDNFRARSASSRIALWAGCELNGANPNYESIRDRLDQNVRELRSLGDARAAALSIDNKSGTNAILCRTNGQALVISEQLNSLNIKHVLQTSATDRLIARWVAIVLRKVETAQIGRSRLIHHIEEINNEVIPNPDKAWALLKRAEGRSGNDLDLESLANRIRCGDVPDDLTENPTANFTVSTIHKSKGLEFDRVLLAEPEIDTNEEGTDEDYAETLPEETRLLYVGLTRSRNELFHVNRPDTKGLKKHKATRRWLRKGFQHWQTKAIEVRGNDVHHHDPAGALVAEGDPVELQEYIRTEVKPGDAVSLRRKFQVIDGDGKTFYVIEHKGVVVGITNESFSRDAFSILRINQGWEVLWPARIDGLRVQATDTVAGLSNVRLMPAYGNGSVWLRVRILGFGTLVFD